jgi:hypothetical protein
VTRCSSGDGRSCPGFRRRSRWNGSGGRLPDDGDLCSQPTISRLENLPDAHALLRMGRAVVDHYCQSFRQVPRRIVLDIEDTFDAVHGGQQLRLFNAHHDGYGFQPIVVFDGGRLGECQEFRVWAYSLDQAWALVKRSPKRMANWALAMVHSRGGMIHAFSARCDTRNSSFMAASSVGKWPRV